MQVRLRNEDIVISIKYNYKVLLGHEKDHRPILRCSCMNRVGQGSRRLGQISPYSSIRQDPCRYLKSKHLDHCSLHR
jgi:hypothetical protein